MSNRNSWKRLLGVGAFVCCSAVLLGVTAHSARSDALPTVSELGQIVTDPFGFVRDQPVSAVVPEEETFENPLPVELTDSSAPVAAAIPSAEDEKTEEAAKAAEAGTVPLLDFTDLEGSEPEAEPVNEPAKTAAVIDGEDGDLPSGISDTLSLTSADSRESASLSGGEDDWMEDGKEDGKTSEKEKTEKPGEENKSGDKDKKGKTDKDAGKSDPEPEDGEKAGESEEKNDKEKKETDEKNEPAPDDDGGEELVAVASVTLSLKTDNKNHREYLHGYDDGTARPGGKITRAEACQILYNLLAQRPADRAVLKDVKDDAWYAEPVRLLAAFSIIDCPDDKARPTDYMTRAELVSALSRLVNGASAGSAGKSAFSDVPASHPYAGAIAAAVKLGWVNGYEDGTFHPDGSITRAETAKVVNRALDRFPDKDWIDKNITEPLYSDLTPEHWAYYELTEASVPHGVKKSNGAETWIPAEEEKPEKEPEKTDEKDSRTAEAHGIGNPESTGWADEELERMLAEPLPEPVDEELLIFEGLDLYASDGKGGKLTDKTLGRYLTFGRDGKYSSGDKSVDEHVEKILEEVTTEDMTREEKLKAAYLFVRDSYFYRRRNFYEPGESGWEVEEARTMYETEKGNCYNFTAAFAMLARALGYDAEAISGLVGGELQAHGWVEIVKDGERLLYDPTLEGSYLEKGFDYDFFGIPYASAPWPYHKH